ncbi:hypothetical protein DEU42_106193 [Flavobacterium sp. AG291]|nr:hypothetical protein DEU42_106193 [Flavobacterium sp. AG291]
MLNISQEESFSKKIPKEILMKALLITSLNNK